MWPFEIYVDIAPLVHQAQCTQIAFAGITAVIPALRYLTRVLVMRRAEKIKAMPQNTKRAVQIIVYRIVQEIIDNLARFAMANLVCVGVSKIDNNITLTIEDNGGMYRSGAADTPKKMRKESGWMRSRSAPSYPAAAAPANIMPRADTASGFTRLA